MTRNDDASGSTGRRTEKVELSRWFEAEEKHGDAIAAVESELRDSYDLEDIDTVEAETMMSGHWKVTVVGVLDETMEGEE